MPSSASYGSDGAYNSSGRNSLDVPEPVSAGGTSTGAISQNSAPAAPTLAIPSPGGGEMRRHSTPVALHSPSHRSTVSAPGSADRNHTSTLHKRHTISSPVYNNPNSPDPDAIHIELNSPATDENENDLEKRRHVLNSLWGIKPYKGHISKRDITERSDIVKELYKPVAGWEALSGGKKTRNRMINLGNILYTMFFGWWMCLVYLFVGILCCLSIIELPYGKKCFELAIYYLWPFGKYLEIIDSRIDAETAYLLDTNVAPPAAKVGDDVSLQTATTVGEVEEDDLMASPVVQEKRKFFSSSSAPQDDESPTTSSAPSAYNSQSRNLPFYMPNLYSIHTRRTPLEWTRYVIFILFFCPMLAFAHFICMTLSWFTTFFIPVAKVHFQGLKILYRDPVKVAVDDQYPPAPGSDIILCTYEAFNIFYYKYSVFGMNVILINLLPFVFLTLLLGYCFGESFVEKYAFVIFPLCLISTVPLAYYIGKAVSSISAQTSFAFGAVLNAAFGTIIELILYFIALHKGLRTVVMNSITGSLIGSMLLMPGAAMIFGGFKHKEQFFNRHAAGVSATLLLMSIIGAFTPSVFYQIYGDYQLECGNCIQDASGATSCSSCHYKENHYEEDYVYSHRAKFLMYVCSALLPLGYIFGLIFTLKTHAYLYEKPVGDPDNPETLERPTTHGAPEWSKTKCIAILFFSTLLFAFVAEAMISAMSPAMEIFHLDDRFASLTLIAVVPNISEYINAAAFGLQNNIVLSLEIGSVAAIQTALLQMPILVIFSALLSWIGVYEGEGSIFTLIFPNINVYTVIFSVLIITYLTVNGRSNYFEGSILILCYIIIVTTFFFTYQDL